MAKLEGVKVIDAKDGEVTKISYEGVEYTKVETEAMSGDIIRYIDDYEDTPSTDFFKVKGDQYVDNSGTTLSINGWGGHHKYTTFSNHGNQSDIEDRISALETRVGALEKVGVGIKTVQAGDIIRITDGLGKRNGEKMTVASVSSSGDVIRVEETDERLDVGGIEFEIIGRKEKPKLNVGDYAKVIGETYYKDIKEGAYIKIDYKLDSERFRIMLINEEDIDTISPENLEKVELTDGDLSFIKAGREPGECRVGDIVEYDDAVWFENKGLGEVVGISDASGDLLVSAKNYEGVDSNYYLCKEDVKLVAPVSARDDKDA